MTTPEGPVTLLIIAKEPAPGYAKTRLTPDYTPGEAALLARESLSDTLDTALASPAKRRILVLDGTAGDWLPPGIEVLTQGSGGLDERIAAAFAQCHGPTLLIGMDTPQVTPHLLAPALAVDTWGDRDAWFGPALDGGFWTIGFADPDPELVRGVPMSVPHTGEVQRERLAAAGLTVRELPTLRDLDTAADLAHVASAAPDTRFAAAVARLNRAATR